MGNAPALSFCTPGRAGLLQLEVRPQEGRHSTVQRAPAAPALLKKNLFKRLSESPPLRQDLLFPQASFGDLGLQAIE